jgi:acylphosphatase
MKIRRMVRITGMVQGVNFRFFTKQNADRLGVNGWVRNLPDGSVAGCFEGDEAAVLALLDWCRIGSPYGRVDSVEVENQEYAGEFNSFTIKR